MKTEPFLIVAALLFIGALTMFLLSVAGIVDPIIRWVALADAVVAVGFAVAGISRMRKPK